MSSFWNAGAKHWHLGNKRGKNVLEVLARQICSSCSWRVCEHKAGTVPYTNIHMGLEYRRESKDEDKHLGVTSNVDGN